MAISAAIAIAKGIGGTTADAVDDMPAAGEGAGTGAGCRIDESGICGVGTLNPDSRCTGDMSVIDGSSDGVCDGTFDGVCDGRLDDGIWLGM